MIDTIRAHTLPRRLYLSLMLTMVCLANAFAYQIITPFWTSKIDSALRFRDGYYKTVLPDSMNFSLILLKKTDQDQLLQDLNAAHDTLNPWYNFILATLLVNGDQKASTYYFTAALSLAYRDPGATWALFVECVRNRQTLWAERCLMLLEKQFLESGATSAPAIAQQLLFYALLAEKQKDNASAASYYGWAERFDRNQAWSIFYRLKKSFPGNLNQCVSSLSALAAILAVSWPLQLACAAGFYEWISRTLMFFTIIVFIGLGIKYLPKTLHSFADHLPEHIPAFFKTVVPIAVICSLISFGAIPFLWILAFLLWYFLDKKEKHLVLFCVFVLILSPVDARVKDMFLQAQKPRGPVTFYARASQEGYSSDIETLARSAVAASPGNPLALLSASLCAAKKGDMPSSLAYARGASMLRPDDLVATANVGNAFFLAGNFDSAAFVYQGVLAVSPEGSNARFNLSQCYARKNDTNPELDFLKLLPQRQQAEITRFINTNNVYFGKAWPPLRQLLFSDYSPAYFWSHIFLNPQNTGTWKTTDALWGASFFGIPPKVSLLLFAVLFGLLMVWHFSPLAKHLLHQVNTCRLCDRVICGRCKKGELCSSCNHATQYIRNVKTLAAIQTRIRNNRALVHRLVEYLLDICIPGSGMLFSQRRPFFLVFFIVTLTSILYALFFLFSTINLTYPHWAPFGFNENIVFLFMAYNVLFVIRALVAAFRGKGTALS